MHVMVHMLALNALIFAEGLLAVNARLGVLILCALVLQATLDPAGIVMFERPSLNRRSFVVMLLGQHFGVVHGLLRGVIVILVHLTIDCGRRLFMFLASDGLVLHGRCYCLMNRGVMFARFGPEEVSIVCTELKGLRLRA